jgi:hypothetical protein
MLIEMKSLLNEIIQINLVEIQLFYQMHQKFLERYLIDGMMHLNDEKKSEKQEKK